LTKFLVKLADIPEDQAEKNACRIEHVIDSDVVNGIKKWLENNP
ncbi:MAG: iron dependent repressor, metal binding and dimerization domain protein, partial [Treponema sp.]|nr:iron dependent repressor, metal binding and dimerization domain protein [Treponema sp.]